MRRLDPGQISDEFNAQKKRFREEHEKSGLLQALNSLSQIIGDIKSAGMDVSLEIFGCPSEQAFAMFPRDGKLISPISGILRIGHDHRLIAFATQVGGADALQLAMSEFDIRFNGPDGKMKEGIIDASVRARVYDLKKDPDAFVKLEKEIIRHCARNDIVDAQDASHSFDARTALRKPSLKNLPKKPS